MCVWYLRLEVLVDVSVWQSGQSIVHQVLLTGLSHLIKEMSHTRGVPQLCGRMRANEYMYMFM